MHTIIESIKELFAGFSAETVISVPRLGRMSAPGGLRYIPSLISEIEEQRALEFIEGLDYQEVKMHGQVAKRTVRQYGLKYEFGTWKLDETDPLPSELEPHRDRAATL